MRLTIYMLFVFVSCTNRGEKYNFHGSDTANTQSQDSDYTSNTSTANVHIDTLLVCDSLLKKLITGSDFDTTGLLSDCLVSVDSYEHKKYLLKVGVYNMELKNESIIGWIEMDVTKKQLRDITLDPENPRNLQFDIDLFRKITQACLNEK